jgi:hypothetical protein
LEVEFLLNHFLTLRIWVIFPMSGTHLSVEYPQWEQQPAHRFIVRMLAQKRF